MQAILEQMLASTATLDVASAAVSGTLRQVLDEVGTGIQDVVGLLMDTRTRSRRDSQP